MTGAENTAAREALTAPSLWRRMACFTYEGLLVFAVWFFTGWLYSTLTQQRNAMVGRDGLMYLTVLVLGIYFGWFWSHGGQTVAMKAWRIKVVTAQGAPLSQARALARYLLSWLWLMPALVAVYLSGLHSAGVTFGTPAVGVIVYALLSRLHPQRQFLHDAACGTRLVDVRATDNPRP